jgi:signal transduction histidine kinase
VDVAYELTPLVVTKLVVYTFGTLIHLFLMVLILGNRRLHRLEWLLFALMAALFMWYSGNLLALNVSLYYGAGPAVLSGFSSTVCLVGFMAAVPLLVHVQAEYGASFVPMRLWQRLVVACFYLPVLFYPWMEGRLLSHLGLEPLVALGPPARLLVLWAVAALLFAVGVNGYLIRQRRAADPTLARFYGYLAGLQGLLALGWAIAFLPHVLPPVGGLGGYFSTGLMLAGILPSGLVGYSIFRYNFLDLRVQRNVIYSVAAIFGFLIYLNFMRRMSGWLEAHDVLPTAVTEGVMIFILVVLVEPVKRLTSRALHQQFVSEFEKVQRLAAEIEEHAKRTGDVDSLQGLVEERVPQALGLERVRLLRGPTLPHATSENVPPKACRVPISRGGEALAYLEVVPATGEVSGEQIAALEILADRLAGALELCRLIADKIKLERELAAKEKMAFLGEMAARIAHNVKNPLSGMKTIVQLMEEDQQLSENTRRDCRMLVDEIDRLNRNISQVLRYAKPARDTDRPADLVSMVKRVAAISRMEAKARHITLEIITEPCLVEGGEEAASDIVSNLLVNSLEASEAGGVIRIRLARPPGQPEYIDLSVEDQGRGIAKDKLDKIFQPFFTTRPGGTGLGLAIVKRRVEEIGGSVDCQSPVQESNATSAHPGTRFVVRFRIAEKARD